MSTDPLPLVPPSEAPMRQSMAVDPDRPAPLRKVARPEPDARSRPAPFQSATDLHNFLEKRSRQLGTAICLLEQQRQHLRAVEQQRDVLQKEFAAISEAVMDAARAVKTATGEVELPGDIDRLVERNRRTLEQLENVAVSLIANFQCWHSLWEQYTQTCAHAKGLKAEMAATEPLVDA